MPVVRCPGCQRELELDEQDLGHRVECPACLHAFTAQAEGRTARPSQPPPPPPPASVDETKVVRCTKCDRDISILKADLGFPVTCPLCSRVFTPRGERGEAPPWRGDRDGNVGMPKYDDDYDRPRRRRRSSMEEDENDPEFLKRRAKTDLSSPGVGLQVIGWIAMGMGIIGIVVSVVMLVTGGGGPRGATMEFGLIYLGAGVASTMNGIVMIIGGKQMAEIKSYGWAMTAAWAAVIPCSIICWPLYIVSLIFGIIALTSLFKPDTKRAFQLNSPDFDPDAA